MIKVKGRTPLSKSEYRQISKYSDNEENRHMKQRRVAQDNKPHRFRIFVIDSGWKSPAAQVLRDNFSMIHSFQDSDPFYVLSRKQSQGIIRRNPVLIGKDPIILVRDLEYFNSQNGEEFHGFHLNLGLIQKPVRVLEALREFLQFLTEHRDSVNIEQDIRNKLHLDGLIGTLEVIRAGAQDAMAG
jgi:hypothetical protein